MDPKCNIKLRRWLPRGLGRPETGRGQQRCAGAAKFALRSLAHELLGRALGRFGILMGCVGLRVVWGQFLGFRVLRDPERSSSGTSRR